MQRFWEFAIKPALARLTLQDPHRAKHIIEIGSDKGLNTQKVLQFCVENPTWRLTAIDPFPQFDHQRLSQHYPQHFALKQALSVQALPTLAPCDVALIDGDHNWYTVYNELKLIEALNERHNYKFPVIFFHDITWPYGRRDMYYDPSNVPAEFRQPQYLAGMLPGVSELVEGGLNSMLMNADHEYGERNGVCTAVEDFIKESPRQLKFHIIEGLHGLGILYEDNEENRGLFDLYEIQREAAKLTEQERLHYLIQLLNRN